MSEIESLLQISRAWLTDALPVAAQVALLLLVGWLAAVILGRLAQRIVAQVADFTLLRTAGRRLETDGFERSAVDAVSRIVFWTVLVLFLAAASEVIGVAVISDVLREVARYVPNIAAVVLVGMVGIIGGNLALNAVRRAAQEAQIASAEALGQLARRGVLLAAAVLALDQLGIESTVLLVLLAIGLATLVGGGALAFALGARESVRGFLAAQELQRTYQLGDRVRIGDLEGQVVELTRTAVLLDTAEGIARVPSVLFERQPSVLVQEER